MKRARTPAGNSLAVSVIAPTRVMAHFDGVFGRLATGWAWLPEAPDQIPMIEILSDGRVVASGPADQFRADLHELGIGRGKQEFRCLLPVELFDGVARVLSARVQGCVDAIPGGPHRLMRTLPRLEDAFAPGELQVAAPLNDFQVVTLRSLVAITGALVEQSRALQRLNGVAPQLALGASEIEDEDDPRLSTEFRRSAGVRDVLVFSIIDWGFRTQRPQHLSMHLGRMGYRVTYIDAHFKATPKGMPGFSLVSKVTDKVFEVQLHSPAPAPSLYQGILKHDHLEFLADSLEALTGRLGIRAPIAIVQYPTWLPLVKILAGSHLVYDCMDHLPGFSEVGPGALECEAELLMRAETVAVSSHYLLEKVTKSRAVAALVRNGADVEFFSTPARSRYRVAQQPVVGYVGAIADWFDVELLRATAKRRADWQFVLVGSTAGADVRPLQTLENVHLVGEMPYAKVPSFLAGFDCCVIPFKLNDLIRATNPVKLYEYFAAGKPVVATAIPELAQAPNHLYRTARTAREFVAAIAAALKEPSDFAAQRRQWAQEHSWLRRAHLLLDAIDRDTPRVSVVVLCYNKLEFTRACLESVLRLSAYPDLEVIAVDNGSTDGTADYLLELARDHPELQVVSTGRNLGFSAGNNAGIARSTGEYIVLLNNDTYVTEGWIQDLVRPLRTNPKAGLCGPVTNMIGNEQKIPIAYGSMEEMAVVARRKTRLAKEKLMQVERLAFFCVAISREALGRIGLLDPVYGIGFFEDDDYCMRAKQAGYSPVICDGVFIHHHHSATFDQDARVKAEMMKRNRKIFEKKWGVWKPHRYRD